MSFAADRIIADQLANVNKIVIVSHIRPDGDAVGSALAFGSALREAGKAVQVVLQDGVSERYLYLPGASEVSKEISLDYDYIIVVDSADRFRVGDVLDGLPEPDLVVDHHKTHINFGKIDYVEPETEATALLLTNKLPDWGLKISKDTATCLMVGLLADTLGFRTNNTTPNALRTAADLMEKGVDLVQVYHQTLSMRSLAEIRYWGQGLTKLAFNDGVLSSTLTLDDRIVAGYPENDDADLINMLTVVPDALISVLFIEQENGGVKVSWRSVKDLDVSEIASQFGGGGHASAAGADVVGELDEVKKLVLEKTHHYMNTEGRT
ncbi:MAG: DHH family phosphoesterase [Anaerolineaceae bacterium]|jgi:phosphoesterase RecJ-like protein|nr:DHH family phosphoesterase [Anaerolineaceae bacterium]MDD4043176.1 DHH family phosphoesterase [Anaerolineaceae bacterium]MDD4578637.1 DHH family phosphoesterase [Anaerolineaceae bacterium]